MNQTATSSVDTVGGERRQRGLLALACGPLLPPAALVLQSSAASPGPQRRHGSYGALQPVAHSFLSAEAGWAVPRQRSL